MSFSRSLATVALVFCGLPCGAWWGKGHEQVADIAWTQLGAEAKKEIGEILTGGDALFKPASPSEADVRTAFRKAATWADWIKDHKEGGYEDWVSAWNSRFQPGYDPADADREAHRCKRWHYFDVPVKFKEPKPGVEGANALVALTAARYEFAALGRQVIKDRKAQCWWLYWIEHVIGDLHQPLHCVSSFEFDPKGDAGGNFFKLGIPYADNPDRMMNLHSFWDAGIENAIAMEAWITPGPEAVTERWVAAFSPSKTDSDDLEFAHWIDVGAKLALSAVYAGIARDGKPSDDYRRSQADLCRKQCVLAGFRLAAEIKKGLGLGS